MSLMKRMMALALSAMLLLAPATSSAEEMLSSYFAGEMTQQVIARGYETGDQLTFNAALGLEMIGETNDKRLKALADLLDRCEAELSLYSEAGMPRVHALLSVDGVRLLQADALVMEDGSVQIMTNLTGKLVLALPEGTYVDGVLDLSALTGNAYAQMSNEAGAVRGLPMPERLKVIGNDMAALLINHLLGWVSYVQMEEGDLYTFDDEYLDATEDRDPVAQRMIGKIDASSFNALLWNIATTICDAEGDFQSTVADLLADMGVTRYQVRRFVDALLTEETIDPALDWVQPSYYIIEANDGSLCTYDDISYFFKKLKKSSFRVYEHSTDAELGMVVSYDDFGSMVGFDAEVPQFSTVLPYEGSFRYSVKEDDFWQKKHTARGELQVYGDNRIIGSIEVLDGEDIDGKNSSHIVGALDVLNSKNGRSAGFGVDMKLNMQVSMTESGMDQEAFEGAALIGLRENGVTGTKAGVTFSGVTQATGERFETYATAMAQAPGVATFVADMSLVQTEREEIAFAGGQAVDLSSLDDAAAEILANEVMTQAAKLGMSLIAHPALMNDLLTLIGD